MRRVLAAAGGDSGKRPRAAGSRFFDERGLKVRSLADDIRHALPLAVGQDGGLYLYRDGVYVTGRDLLLAEIGSRLDEQYRPPHARAVIEFLTAQLRREGRLLDTAPTGSLLNVRNGMLDLTTEELLPHDPRYLSSVQVPVAWDPGARAPVYESWVREQAGGQVEDLEEITGTMLDRAWPPSKAMFLFGPTRSGKSTYLRLMAAVAGPQNYSAVTLAQLGTNRFAAAALHGKLLNSAADLSSHHVDDLATFKLMTGGDPVSAEHKFGQWFQFTNHALFAFSANEVPSVGETSNAYLERMKPFSFGSSFAGREDPAVEERMLRELPGILARWVRALQTLRGRGHPLPTRPEVAAAFARGSDRVRAFLDEMTVPNEVGTPRTQLYGDFKAWAMSNGGAVLGRNKFHDRVRNAGVHEYKHRDRGMSYKVRTIDPDRPPQDVQPGPDPDQAAAGSNGGSCGSSVTTSTSTECHHGTTSSRVGEEGRETATTATVVFDLETADADRLYTYTPHDQQGYVRLFAYNDQVSHDAAPLLAVLRNAPEIVGHNVLGFDLQALARHHGLNYREMATKTRDTLVLARLQDPPMSRDAHPDAKYSLDALASAHFDEGKASDLGALRDQHGGYDHIPVDDPSYRAYIQQDVRLTRWLADLYPMTAYGQREHQLLGIAGELSLQGFRVDTAALETQLREQAHRREELRRQLPLTEPLATTKGRQQLARAFAEHGVALPRSAGGFPLVNRECMDGVLARFPPDHPAARLAADVREINGQRGLLAQVSRSLVDDRVHARITAGQATGRWSVTNPGLTTLGKRGGLHVERSIFLPEDGHVIMVADLSQVDARAVAAHCQDQGFLELFGPGRDFHQEVAVAVFGDPGKRDLAKALNHSVNYGVGAAKLSEMTGVSRATAQAYLDGMAARYRGGVGARRSPNEPPAGSCWTTASAASCASTPSGPQPLARLQSGRPPPEISSWRACYRWTPSASPPCCARSSTTKSSLVCP